jgi:quinol-cytochrome oxidoreductase complex cytochrome b subunit
MDAMLILAAIILGLAFLVFFLVRKPKNGPADTAQIKSEQTSKLEANKKVKDEHWMLLNVIKKC